MNYGTSTTYISSSCRRPAGRSVTKWSSLEDQHRPTAQSDRLLRVKTTSPQTQLFRRAKQQRDEAGRWAFFPCLTQTAKCQPPPTENVGFWLRHRSQRNSVRDGEFKVFHFHDRIGTMTSIAMIVRKGPINGPLSKCPRRSGQVPTQRKWRTASAPHSACLFPRREKFR